jgi:hypothetical protein
MPPLIEHSPPVIDAVGNPPSSGVPIIPPKRGNGTDWMG